MANINDYLKWRGDIKISKEFPLNELDNMILSRFSYLPFDRIKLSDVETPKTLYKKMQKFSNDVFLYTGDKEMIELMSKSPRFSDLLVTDYEFDFDKSIEKQFAAITIHLSNKEMFLSYCGTDRTLTGWKEDFNLAYMENIPAQIEALDYLKKQAKKYNNKKILIGGHSKGGNIAIYSGIKASKKIQKRIVKISNYDGPGFSHNMIESIENPEIISRIHSVIPQESVIGRLLEHREKTYIVKSNEKGLYQHDIFSWEVFKDDIVRLPNVDKFSEVVNDTVREWLKKTTPEQRKMFVDGIFGILYSTEVSTFREFWSSILRNTPTMFKAYKGINEKDRKMITNMMKEFGKSYYSAFRKNNGKKAKKEAIS